MGRYSFSQSCEFLGLIVCITLKLEFFENDQVTDLSVGNNLSLKEMKKENINLPNHVVIGSIFRSHFTSSFASFLFVWNRSSYLGYSSTCWFCP